MIKINDYAEQVCFFTFETISGWSDEQYADALAHYGHHLNDNAHYLNDSRGWNLTRDDVAELIKAAEKIWLEYYAE